MIRVQGATPASVHDSMSQQEVDTIAALELVAGPLVSRLSCHISEHTWEIGLSTGVW